MVDPLFIGHINLAISTPVFKSPRILGSTGKLAHVEVKVGLPGTYLSQASQNQ